MKTAAPLAAVLLATAACATAATEEAPATETLEADSVVYGPQERFKGVLSAAFELSAFGSCWFTGSETFSAEFSRSGIEPPPGWDLVEYELEFIGRRSKRRSGSAGSGSYGHLGAFPCQIRGEKLISARRIPGRPVPPPPPEPPRR